MKSGKGKAKAIQSDFVQLRSMDDLARLAASFDSSMASVYAVREGKMWHLLFPDEKLEDSVNVYYLDVAEAKRYLVYDPSIPRAEMKESLRDDLQNYKANKIEIIRMKESPFTPAKKPAKVKAIELEDQDSIIRGMVNLSADKEEVGKVYVFELQGKSFIGTFELLHRKGVEIFAYAKMKKEGRPAFFRYEYAADSVTLSDSISDNASPHVRAINMERPFSFLKG